MVSDLTCHSHDISCNRCGEPIGVYELMVVVVDDQPIETSRLAHPELLAGAGARFHALCYPNQRQT